MQTQSKNKRKFSKPKSKKGSFLIKRTFSAKIVHLAPSGFLPRNTKIIELGRLLSPKDFCWIYCSSVSFERHPTLYNRFKVLSFQYPLYSSTSLYIFRLAFLYTFLSYYLHILFAFSLFPLSNFYNRFYPFFVAAIWLKRCIKF